MTLRLPPSIQEPLIRSLLGDRGVAWAIVERSGVVREVGGDWSIANGHLPHVGQPLAEHLDVVEGLLPATDRVECLSRIEISNGRFVDLHLGPAGEDASFVLLRDVSEQALAETRLLRRANDLSLLRSALGRELELEHRPGPERLSKLFGTPAEGKEISAWTACVRLDPTLSAADRQRWGRWVEEWLLERSSLIQRRGDACFLVLFGALPEEASPLRAALECVTELRESLGRHGFDGMTFALANGTHRLRLVRGSRLSWDGAPVQRAWRLARSAARGQIRVDAKSIEGQPELAHDCVPVPGETDALLFVQGSEDIPDPATVLAHLGVLVLRPKGGAGFRVDGPVPAWLERQSDTLSHGAELPVLDVFPFLEVFLDEAESIWNRADRGLAFSGIWSQDDTHGHEDYFEAIALRTTSGGRYLLVQTVDRHIDERRALLQGVHTSRLDLEQQRKTLDRREVLLHCIVHDLRGPLANVLAALSGLGHSLKDADEFQTEMVRLGREAAERQDEMIRSLLEVFAAEIESLEGYERDAASAPDGLSAVREVAESFRLGLEQAGITLDVDLDAEAESHGVSVVGRMDRLQRVLANLLENARRHAPPGSRVRIGARVLDGGVMFEVVDEGPGVDPALAGILFGRFQRGTLGGAAGLGLFFCRTTVERWGGHIGHEPGPEGRGARFWFWLPRAR